MSRMFRLLLAAAITTGALTACDSITNPRLPEDEPDSDDESDDRQPGNQGYHLEIADGPILV